MLFSAADRLFGHLQSQDGYQNVSDVDKNAIGQLRMQPPAQRNTHIAFPSFLQSRSIY